MNILVVTKGKGDKIHYKTVGNVEEFLKSKKIKYLLKSKIKLKPKYFEKKDLVIAVGGDGTFLETASYIFNDTKILGVKSTPNSVGAHCTADFNDVNEKLERILDNNYNVIKGIRLEARLDNKLIETLASNEIFVGNKNPQGGSKYLLKFGAYKEKQSSSGVVCTVGMGSSGWYQNISESDGMFPWDSNYAKFIIREGQKDGQYACKLIKHGVLDRCKSLKIKSLMYKNGSVAFDGSVETDKKCRVYDFKFGSIVEISISNKPLSVIYFDKI